VTLADFDAYEQALRSNQPTPFIAQSVSGGSRMMLAGTTFVPAPSAPTTSVALDSTSLFSVQEVPSVGAGRLTLLGAQMNPSGPSGMTVMVVDALNMSGGLAGNLSTAQTTNLPTAALTRYTSGEGVMAALVIHSNVGTIVATVTASYTNQSGTGSRTTTAMQLGGTGWREAQRVITLPLQAGDTGVRSVESVTLAAPTSGSAGNFGVLLYKPLAMIGLNDQQGAHAVDAVSSGGMIGALAEVEDDACLTLLATSVAPQSFQGALLLAEV
jgi:hypothetical protein